MQLQAMQKKIVGTQFQPGIINKFTAQAYDGKVRADLR